MTVTCPHCRSTQAESNFAKSTICRSCGQYFDLRKPLPTHHHQEAKPSFLGRVSRFFSREEIRRIHCFQCGAALTVSSSAKSSICSHCSAYLDLKDFKITTLLSRNIETQGIVEITEKGEVNSPKVACGTARVKYTGKIYGAIEAHELIIEKRSNVEFVRPMKAQIIEIMGKVSGRIVCDGSVSIRKSGALDGTIYAKSVNVEKGGIFSGQLFIGKYEMEQPELLATEAYSDQLDQIRSREVAVSH